MLLDNFKFAYKTRKAWWYTATSRSRARFARTTLGSFWLGFSNLLSIGTLGIVYGTVFSVADFRSYFIYLGISRKSRFVQPSSFNCITFIFIQSILC